MRVMNNLYHYNCCSKEGGISVIKKWLGYKCIILTAIHCLIVMAYPTKKVLANNTLINEILSEGYFTFLIILCTVLFILLIFMIVLNLRFKLIADKKATETERELKHITNSVHVGFVNFDVSNNHFIHYASKGFYDMMGYSKEEVAHYENSLLAFIHPFDVGGFVLVREGTLEDNSIQKELRLITKDGTVLWALMNGNYICDREGCQIISAVFVDITESRKMRERIQLEEERYRVAAEISNDILFEYNIEDDIMIYASKFEELYGREPIINNFSKLDLNNTDFIYHEDRGVFSEYSRALRSGKGMVESEFRIINANNVYVWCHTRGKTIFDEKKNPIRVIGKIVNIDLHKKELQTLEYKAKRDPLTSVYNKSITKELIDSFTENYPNGTHVFTIIDIDDFKGINDRYGHLQGDKILTFVVNEIKKIFNSGEILGRIGGDEFVVFIGNISDRAIIKQKADLLQKAIRTVYHDDFCDISVSGSIGVSVYPRDGKNYNELLMCADKALYEVKEDGKDGYKLFT
jgi:diguanylate cyclase (GGDEF)-like protein/PAS domain S-box-containing protein